MRLFLALELSPSVADALEEALAPVRLLEPALAWVPPERRHLTLRFLGDVSPESSESIAVAMDHLAGRQRPFAMQLASIGGFPSLRRARVVWTGVESEARLELLHHDLEVVLESLGYELEGRPFRPHVTVARVRSPLGSDRGRALARAARRVAFSMSQNIVAITLFESILAPTGVSYRRAHTAHLEGR